MTRMVLTELLGANSACRDQQPRRCQILRLEHEDRKPGSRIREYLDDNV